MRGEGPRGHGRCGVSREGHVSFAEDVATCHPARPYCHAFSSFFFTFNREKSLPRIFFENGVVSELIWSLFYPAPTGDIYSVLNLVIIGKQHA
jgi:hypothetical protein